MISLLLLVACRGGVDSRDSIPHTHSALVDDFRVRSALDEDLGRSRLDLVRTYVGNVNTEGDTPILNLSPAGGIRFTLPVLPELSDKGIILDQVLGPNLVFDVQPTIVGLRVALSGSGELSAHLDAPDGTQVWSASKSYRQGTNEVFFEIETDPVSRVTQLGIDVARGFADVQRVEMLFEERRPYESVIEEAYVFSQAQFSRCWDGAVGLARVRCTTDDADAVYAPDITGLYALSAAVGVDLGIVPEAVARDVVTDARDALLALPRDPQAGLLPDRTNGTELLEGGTWSSLATVVGVEATILAAKSFDLRIEELVGLLSDIQWDELTTNNGVPILAGYDERGVPLGFRYGVFGSKSAVLQVAHVGATGLLAPMDFDGFTPTWDGTGWDNELAALFFPMTGVDWVGNDWTVWRSGSHWQHHTWSRETPAGEAGLFGLSTAEMPEPWALDGFEDPLGNWGVGGHNQVATDGNEEFGYSFYAPHYAAMTSAEFPETATPLFTTLLNRQLLTPFNAVESVGVIEEGGFRFNHRLRGTTLALQSLGLARALSEEGYLPYRLLDTVPFLRDGHRTVIPEANE